MNNQTDQFRHSLLIGLTDEEVMAKVKAAIKNEREEKQAQYYQPFISWEHLLTTKLFNKTYL